VACALSGTSFQPVIALIVRRFQCPGNRKPCPGHDWRNHQLRLPGLNQKRSE